MTNREENILEAALRAFTRFGVTRTSMADIAREAGISRQTLYKSFRSKDDVLRTHLRLYTEAVASRMEAALADAKGLEQQLDVIFREMTIASFDLVRATPNGQEIEDEFEEGSREELEKAAQLYQAIIKGVLMPFETELCVSGTSPKDLADFIQRSARAAKAYAKDRNHLLQQLATLKQLCLTAAKASH
ncbi:MAG: helix-turn-helix domain-containing protein [Pseudomonadota bacterium]